MKRRFVVPAMSLAGLLSFSPLVQAQRGGHGHVGGGGGTMVVPRSLPLSPGVVPGSPIGPGTQFLAQPAPHFVPRGFAGGTTQYLRPNASFSTASSRFVQGNRVGFGYGFGYGGYGYGYSGYGYGSGGYGYSYGGYGGYGATYYSAGGWYEPQIWLGNEFPATLTVQLPSGDTPKEYSLTSPILKPDERYTFSVNVRWVRNGKTYEAKREVTLGARDRSRLLIVSGDEVKE